MSDWQPIETAPAVGKKRLLFKVKGKKLVVVGFKTPAHPSCFATGYGRLPCTHWMPLPHPPQE